jgi:F0F1-type ATP synthase assembly protein I
MSLSKEQAQLMAILEAGKPQFPWGLVIFLLAGCAIGVAIIMAGYQMGR